MRKLMAVLLIFFGFEANAGFQCSTDALGVTTCTDGAGNGVTCTTDAFGITRCI